MVTKEIMPYSSPAVPHTSEMHTHHEKGARRVAGAGMGMRMETETLPNAHSARIPTRRAPCILAQDAMPRRTACLRLSPPHTSTQHPCHHFYPGVFANSKPKNQYDGEEIM
jgi:hypothetical protein